MRTVHVFFVMLIASIANGQILQDIHEASVTTNNLIAGIDSIRFSAAGDEMQIVFSDGLTVNHSLAAIDSVTFSALAENPLAHSCGADSVHNPNLTYGSVVDEEGNFYKTIVIGTQEWMAENLKAGKYSNGDIIANVTDSVQWEGLTTGGWCHYLNDSQYECPYGKMYNWYAAADPRNLCPVGWHVPSDEDWDVLVDYLGGNGYAGIKMKSVGSQYWVGFPGVVNTNETGFSGLPAGDRGMDGPFEDLTTHCAWWSTAVNGSTNGWIRYTNWMYTALDRLNTAKWQALSIRCIRD